MLLLLFSKSAHLSQPIYFLQMQVQKEEEKLAFIDVNRKYHFQKYGQGSVCVLLCATKMNLNLLLVLFKTTHLRSFA